LLEGKKGAHTVKGLSWGVEKYPLATIKSVRRQNTFERRLAGTSPSTGGGKPSPEKGPKRSGNVAHAGPEEFAH